MPKKTTSKIWDCNHPLFIYENEEKLNDMLGRAYHSVVVGFQVPKKKSSVFGAKATAELGGLLATLGLPSLNVEINSTTSVENLKTEEWCIAKLSTEFVAKMEDILDTYQRPYDPLNPVVCIDETNKQLIKEIRIPCAPGQPERVDSVYERNGVADIFMIFEPLAGKRETIVTETRNAIDFANILKFTSDAMYPHAEKIVLVTDNLNTHSSASLYKAFPPEEANRLANRFEWHYTPNHGSWLDMAEIEIGIMSRQALAKPLPDLESFKSQVKSWTFKRNMECTKVDWQFTTADAGINLKHLY